MNLRSCETQKITCKPPHYIRDGTQSSPSVAMHQIQRTLNVPANLQRPPNPIPEINNKHATCDLILFHFIIPQRQKKEEFIQGGLSACMDAICSYPSLHEYAPN